MKSNNINFDVFIVDNLKNTVLKHIGEFISNLMKAGIKGNMLYALHYVPAISSKLNSYPTEGVHPSILPYLSVIIK